jgi:glycerol-3-phosphate acyltransferase PlsY
MIRHGYRGGHGVAGGGGGVRARDPQEGVAMPLIAVILFLIIVAVIIYLFF